MRAEDTLQKMIDLSPDLFPTRKHALDQLRNIYWKMELKFEKMKGKKHELLYCRFAYWTSKYFKIK